MTQSHNHSTREPCPADTPTLANFDLRDQLTPGKHQVTGEYFVKRRGQPGRKVFPLATFFRRLMASQARREQRCYAILEAAGVPCPRVVDVVETRGTFRLLESSKIVTELIADAIDLRIISTDAFFAELRANVAWRKRVVVDVARWLRHMHSRGIFTRKLHFGNVLTTVDPTAEVKVYFIDITGDIKGRFPCRWYKRTKDVAYLYRDARQWCTPRERVLFMHELLGTRKLSAKDRAFIKRLIRYAENKWGMKTSLGTPVA